MGIVKLPTSRQLAAARALAGLKQAELARRARIDITTVSRAESGGDKIAPGHASTIQAIVDALEGAGVAIDPDGSIRPSAKPAKPRR